MFLWGFLGYEGLTKPWFGSIMHARYGDRKVWDRGFGPSEDYDAI